VARDAGQGAGAGEGGSLVRMLRESDRDSSVDEVQGREGDRWSPSYWDDVGRANITEMVSSSPTAGRDREKERERDISRDRAQHLSCTTQTARRALRLLLESDGPRS
jgi:hypothetical protein